MLLSLSLSLALLLTLPPQPSIAARSCCAYTVNSSTSPSHAVFTSRLETDFLHVHDLGQVSSAWTPQAYRVTPAASRGPYGRLAQVANVVANPVTGGPADWGAPGTKARDPGLQLWVRGLQGDMVPMAEIASVRDDVLYGSVRVGMRTSGVQGTCGAVFFYFNDTEEIDVEFLSREGGRVVNLVSRSSGGEEEEEDSRVQALEWDAAGGFHEYRFDWVPGRVDFYADGKLLSSMTEDVPRAAGRIHLSHWSNGNPGWSAGPPEEDAVLTVSYVKAYFNSSVAASTAELASGCEPCEIPDVHAAPDPSGPNGNTTGHTFFFGSDPAGGNSSGESSSHGQQGPGSRGVSFSRVWLWLVLTATVISPLIS